MKVLHVVGARPNFVKVAPVHSAIARCGEVRQVLLHTGQHYSRLMSEVFIRQLGLPEPHINLAVGSSSHSHQTASIMLRFEKALADQSPDLVIVYGDVNSTLVAALVCSKARTPLAHVEAGLRSFDRSMPEEINRILTDQISDLLFTPSEDADRNLKREGIAQEKIHLVGNVMIDSLVSLLDEAARREIWHTLQLDSYALVTLHRPSNVDDIERLSTILAALEELSRRIDVVFPLHPRTRKRLERSQIWSKTSSLRLLDPLGYLDFLALESKAKLVITDSGGVQEETTYLGVPCLTLRDSTERPVTVEMGTNTVVGTDVDRMLLKACEVLNGDGPGQHSVPPLWDGRASQRIAAVIVPSR